MQTIKLEIEDSKNAKEFLIKAYEAQYLQLNISNEIQRYFQELCEDLEEEMQKNLVGNEGTIDDLINDTISIILDSQKFCNFKKPGDPRKIQDLPALI